MALNLELRLLQPHGLKYSLQLRKRTDNVRTTNERLSPQFKHYVHAHHTYFEVQITIEACSSNAKQFQTVDLVAHPLKLGLKFSRERSVASQVRLFGTEVPEKVKLCTEKLKVSLGVLGLLNTAVIRAGITERND